MSSKAVAAAAREYREWYCSVRQWITDFHDGGLVGHVALGGLAGRTAADSHQQGQSSSSFLQQQQQQQQQQELFLVPADENFPRCPVSREMFECEFDEEQGEMVYLNAAKVLVAAGTGGGDSSVYALGKPTADEPSVRYLVVHKVLVLDTWLALGQAASLRNAVTRYEQMSGVSGVVDRLRRAAGEDENEDDVFVHF